VRELTSPASGLLLVSHLAAFGLAAVLADHGETAWVVHDPDSQTFEPRVLTPAAREAVDAAVRRSASVLEAAVEADLPPVDGKGDRRPLLWARASVERARAGAVLALRERLLREQEEAGRRLAADIAAGLGAPLAWGPEHLKSPGGATRLDGVMGNSTSDFVRGCLRRLRPYALTARDVWADGPVEPMPDRTNWSPEGTALDPVTQWLAVCGLALLPVGHRQLERSATPAWAVVSRQATVALPVLRRPASLPRLRALLALADLPKAAQQPTPAIRARLRAHGVDEVVCFDRREGASGGGSVAFRFDQARRIAL
jgi:hypothetical protein